MEVWESIRLRCRRDGEQIKPTARDLGIAPNTLRKYLRQDTPPKSKTLMRPKLLDRYQKHVDDLIRSTPRITAARVGSYLRQNVDADLRIGERACAFTSQVAARSSSLKKLLSAQHMRQEINHNLISHQCRCILPSSFSLCFLTSRLLRQQQANEKLFSIQVLVVYY